MNFKARRRDQFKGHKGKLLRKKLYGNKRKNCDVIDDEIKTIDQALEKVGDKICLTCMIFRMEVFGHTVLIFQQPYIEIQRRYIVLLQGIFTSQHCLTRDNVCGPVMSI